MKAKDKIDAIAALAVVALFLCVIGGLAAWKWHECRKVGHGVAYCLLVEMDR